MISISHPSYHTFHVTPSQVTRFYERFEREISHLPCHASQVTRFYERFEREISLIPLSYTSILTGECLIPSLIYQAYVEYDQVLMSANTHRTSPTLLGEPSHFE
jgi:hypothetical protein